MEALLANWLVLASAAVVLLWILFKMGKSRQNIEDLHQKAVIITGCDTGFGHELAKRLDAHGVTVYAGVLFPEGDGAAKLKEACSSRLRVLHLDVTRDDHVTEAVKTVTETLAEKKLWAVVNNAGIATCGGFEWTPMETLKKIMDVNTFGTVKITTAFLPLLKQSCGRVVIVASVSGHHSIPGMLAYNMSKYAAVAFSDTIRRELRMWSVSVHLINPFMYRTHISSPEFLHKELTKNWETAKFKSGYPSTYFSDFEKSLILFLSLGRPKGKICEVVDDMEDAVIALKPKVSYFPGLCAKLFHLLFILAPVSFMDYLTTVTTRPLHNDGKTCALDVIYALVSKNRN